MDNKLLNPSGKFVLDLPFFNKYPLIASDPSIHSGWPHIKGTRVLASDIFVANMFRNYTYEKIIMDLKEIDVEISKEQITEAIKFTLDSLQYLTNDKAL